MARPAPEHQLALSEIMAQLQASLPSRLCVLHDVDIDLQIVPAHRRRAEGGVLRASELVVAIELVSVGSERTDHVIKRGEYADAGVPHYWIVEIDDRPALVAHHHAGEFGYVAALPVTGTFTTDEPFPVRLDLDRLG